MGYALKRKRVRYAKWAAPRPESQETSDDDDKYRLHQDNAYALLSCASLLAKWAYCVVVRWAVARPLQLVLLVSVDPLACRDILSHS